MAQGIAGTHEYEGLAELDVRNIEVEFGSVSVLSKMWAIAPLEHSHSTQAEAAAAQAASAQLAHASVAAGLQHAPRQLQSSISSPAVSSLAHHPVATAAPAPAPHAAAPSAVSAAAAPSTTVAASSAAAAAHVPPSHTLRPYENLVLFVRVTNLPGSFGTHPHPPGGGAGGPAGEKGPQQLHVSQSANNLQLVGAPPKPHHSCVPFGAASASVSATSSSSATGPVSAAASVLDVSTPAVSHLLHMEKQLMIEEEKQTLIVNPAAVLADVGAPNRLDLVFAWRSRDGSRRGVYHAPGLASMKAQAAACSLKVLLSYPRTVRHDFGVGAAASGAPSVSGSGRAPAFSAGGCSWLDVPVSVRIRNTLEESCVSFSFETLPPEEEFDPAKRSFRLVGSPALRGRYTWFGGTKCRVQELAPGASCDVQLYAHFSAPGVYNLNRFRFTVEVPGKKPRVFFFPLQHLIHVEQADRAAVAAAAAAAMAAGAAAPAADQAAGVAGVTADATDATDASSNGAASSADPSDAASTVLLDESVEVSATGGIGPAADGDDVPASASAPQPQPQTQLESVEELDVDADADADDASQEQVARAAAEADDDETNETNLSLALE